MLFFCLVCVFFFFSFVFTFSVFSLPGWDSLSFHPPDTRLAFKALTVALNYIYIYQMIPKWNTYPWLCCCKKIFICLFGLHSQFFNLISFTPLVSKPWAEAFKKNRSSHFNAQLVYNCRNNKLFILRWGILCAFLDRFKWHL